MIKKFNSTSKDRSEPKSLEELGEEAFKECNEKYSKVLRSLGKSLQEFLNGVGNFVELLKAKDNCYFSKLPFLHCKTADNQSELELHCYDRRMRDEWDGFVKGVVKSAAKTLFDVSVSVELAKDCREDTDLETEIYHTAFKIVKSPERQCKTSLKTLQHEEKNHSVSPVDLKISVPMLCSAFPFLLIFDEVLQIQQLGSALTRLIGPLLSGQDTSFDKFFQILEPKVRLTFTSILSRKNGLFVLRLKTGKEETVGLMSESGEIELRGQMIDLPESSCMLFLGSPRVESLEQLQGRGLYLSDIPLYDATRGLILVSEQALAQDGLKKKMEQLKTELQDASQELAREKRKTEDLLESIFPRDVAKKLIHRKAVPAKFVNDVSILFSDIVGFTSICGKCAPMEVVEMLNDLYTEFDRICGQLDLFKIETIGDAYVVAGGLQNNHGTADDAVKVALMALSMINVARGVLSPAGIPLQMRIGLHTGSVLTGVVGVKMPRYCLFGNNVTIANKMESDSEAGKINISSSTHRFICSHADFQLIFRPMDPCRRIAGGDLCVKHRYFLQWRPGHEPPSPRSSHSSQRWLLHS